MRAQRRSRYMAAVGLVPGCTPAPDPDPGDAGLEGPLPAALHDARDRHVERVASRLEVAP